MPIPAAVAGKSNRLRDAFQTARPYRHVVIDDFFEPDFAERLLEEFPSFDRRLANSESGEVGGKAVNTRISEISPAYLELYREISSEPFLALISKLSGIPDLILDAAMFGGGTHENLHGQELDPHVDFNYDEAEQMHRRLNLIVYLNKGWKNEWGGGLEVHSNPRKPQENEVRTYEPLFNRAVMFETNEYSWHGFSKIALPGDKRHLSRKSISIYLYTKGRPEAETAPRHATFYVQRPLPDRFAEGYALRPEDVIELKTLLIRRDRWIELYQKMELDTNALIGGMQRELTAAKQNARIPLTGYIGQEGPAHGFHHDLWVEPSLRVRLTAVEPVVKLELRGYRPESSEEGRVSVFVNGAEIGAGEAGAGQFMVGCALQSRVEGAFDLEVKFTGQAAPKSDSDDRDLAFMLLDLRALHPFTSAFRQRRTRP
jgi:2OG-Fe(II) oxygenase superfamily